MTYVTSDLHGALDRYNALLRAVDFSEDDVLYVLGDTVDFGEQTVELLTDMSMRVNVYPVAGEHDLLALRMLSGFDKMLKSGSMPDEAFAAQMSAWAMDGGKATLDGFRALDDDMREGILDYLSEFVLYEEVSVGERDYVLVHGGIAAFDPATPLYDYEPEDFFTDTKEGTRYFDDRTVVVGHTPTASGKIEKEEGLIRLCCGKGADKRIACICLETGEEFYV